MPFSGHGGTCKGSGGYLGQQTAASCHDAASRGRPPLLWSESLEPNRLGRMAHESAAQAEAVSPKLALSTSCDRRRKPCDAETWVQVCVYRTIPHGSTLGIQGVCMASRVFVPWAVTSLAKTKTPEPAHPRRDDHWLRRSTLWPLAILTCTRDLQSRQ